MTIQRKSLSLLLTAAMLVTTGVPLGTNSTPSVRAAGSPPVPLPFECGGVTPPGETTCCIYGYVYYDGVPVAGVNVHVASSHGVLDATTSSGGASSYPYYSGDLSSAPLRVSIGETITITASYNGMISTRTWAVQANGQQVDLGLVAGYQVPDAPSVRKSRRRGGAMFALSAEALGSVAGQASFTDIGAGLADVYRSGVWGDYDNDGDLDILLSGCSAGCAAYHAQIYRNDSGIFTDIGAGLGEANGDAAWGDYDNDGDLDILLADPSQDYLAKVYRNDGGDTFTNIAAGLPANIWSLAWGDYDNDGDLDIVLSSNADSPRITAVYRNDGSDTFTDIDAGLTGARGGSVDWGDYDNDGDLDILLTGWTGSATITQVYRNDGADTFTDIAAGLTGSYMGAAAWGDYDNDGDLDILLSGSTGGSTFTKVYRNDGGGTFVDLSAGLTAVEYSAVAWGDYDNDGDLDVLLSGWSYSGLKAEVHRNDGGTFTNINAGLTGVSNGSVAWGDYDNDGDLDVLLTGWTGSAPIARVYRNDGVVANTRPAAPAGLATSVTDTAVTFGWTAAADSQTPAAGLTYNLRVGTTPGGANVLSPMSHSSGYRKVVALGNANHGLTATLQNLAPGTYYWSVQAVDTAFAGSAFASEASFVVAGAAVAPTAVTITGPTTGIVNTVYSFTAAVSPVVATTPLTYVWQTAGQPPITHTGGLSDTVDLTWSMPGTKSITVTATNPGGMTVDTHVIAATLPTNTVYLSDLAYYFHYQPIFSLGLDETVLGLPLTINGIIYAKGLGTHASSETIYDLGEIHDYTTFKTWVGHDDEATEPCGNGMIFLVSVGTGSPESISWTPVWTSTIHNFYYPAEQMPDVAVTNYRWLRLQTDDLASPSCDHADWADARLTVAEHAVRFSAASYSVNEDVGAATITVTLNAPATQTVTVGYATSDGTATAGSDYIAATGTLTFSPGITSQTFTVPLSDDSLCETGETVHLALSSPANAILGTPSMATLTIVDDDTTPLTDVTITGPATGVIDTGYTFTATISPITATTPITYVWQADGQSPITHTSGLSDTVALTWNTTGTKSITVTVTNIGGTVGDTHVSAITLPTNTVYLSDLDYYSHYQSAYDLSLDQSVLGLPLTINGVTYAKGLGTHASSETIYDLGEMHDYTTFKTWVGHDDEFGAPCGNGMIFLVSVGTGSPESISWTRVWTSTVHNFFDDAERMPDTDVTGYRWLRLETDDLADSYCDHADWAAARLDGGGQPSVYFSADSYSVNENDGLAAITVSLNAPATQTVTVDYATSDGTATAGSDYIALTGTLAFSPGLTSQTFAVPISADSLGEPDETVHLALSSPANAILGTPSMATLTIVDDDATPLTGVAISGPTTGVVNTVYPFTATASPIAATTPITYVWQTAGQSLLTHTGGLSDTVDWTWSLPGTKSITVTATNAGGTVTSTHVITVGELAPEAAFSAAPLSGVVPLTVTFTDESTGNITAWSWDFGDGGTSADQHPTHVYTRTGTYTTALLVSGPGGSDAETKVAYITVSHPAPAAAFIASPVTGTVPLNVAFTDQATGAIIAWDWTFGDASVSGARYPEHEYTIPGTYTISLTVTGPGGSDTETKSNYITAAPGEISWVFLLYLAGDNWDLYPWLQAALDRLEAASANPHLTILVLIDGPDHGDTWRYHVQPDGNCIEGVNCWDMNELNMGDPQTLSDFVIWARDNYTATHYYLAVADHGRGTTGIAWDDTPFVGDFLTVTELRTALRDATAYGATPLDVVHYDACLMAMIEDAYQVKDYARYLVASENLGWGIFAYDRYAAWVVADTSPEQLAHAIVDEYHYVLAGDELPHTISAMDLEQAGAVEDAVTTLAIALQADLAANKEYVSNSRSATQKFDSQEYYIISNDDEYLDLYDFARLIKQSVPDSSVKNAAQGVMNAVSACVVAERHQSGDYLNYIDPATDAPPYWDLNDAHGVAIYFPPQPGGYGYAAYVNNASFRFTVDGQWDEFLQAYYAVMGLPSEPPVDPGVPPVPVPPFKVYLPLIAKEN